MLKLDDQSQAAEAPLYIRWSADRSPHAIELRLDIVRSMTAEIAEAEKLGIEIGGILLGSLPTASVPVLRIDNYATVSRPPEDGSVYLLDPLEQERFASVRAGASRGETAPVGFFRSHIRPGPLRPSLADRSLLAGQFKESVYAVLLIQARPPRTAAFFVAADGQLPVEPSVNEFRFDETEFRALPELEQLAITEPEVDEGRARTTRVRMPRARYRAILSVVDRCSLRCGGGLGSRSRPMVPGWRESPSRRRYRKRSRVDDFLESLRFGHQTCDRRNTGHNRWPSPARGQAWSGRAEARQRGI